EPCDVRRPLGFWPEAVMEVAEAVSGRPIPTAIIGDDCAEGTHGGKLFSREYIAALGIVRLKLAKLLERRAPDIHAGDGHDHFTLCDAAGLGVFHRFSPLRRR